MKMISQIRRWYRRRHYRPGRVLVRFLAKDVRREVDVVDVSQIDAGLLTARTRTWNVLHAAKGLAPKPPFGDVRAVAIEDLWAYSGEEWGGPVPEADR